MYSNEHVTYISIKKTCKVVNLWTFYEFLIWFLICVIYINCWQWKQKSAQHQRNYLDNQGLMWCTISRLLMFDYGILECLDIINVNPNLLYCGWLNCWKVKGGLGSRHTKINRNTYILYMHTRKADCCCLFKLLIWNELNTILNIFVDNLIVLSTITHFNL